jgi:hypothetical protein
MTQTLIDGWWTVHEIATLFPGKAARTVHPATVRQWIRTGIRGSRLPARRIGSRLFVRDADLRAFLDAFGLDLDEAREPKGAPCS